MVFKNARFSVSLRFSVRAGSGLEPVLCKVASGSASFLRMSSIFAVKGNHSSLQVLAGLLGHACVL